MISWASVTFIQPSALHGADPVLRDFLTRVAPLLLETLCRLMESANFDSQHCLCQLWTWNQGFFATCLVPGDIARNFLRKTSSSVRVNRSFVC